MENNNQNLEDNNSKENDEIKQLKNEILEMKDKWIRAVAETENLRKRFIREKEDSIKFAIQSFAKDMLTISDNLNLAIQNCNNTNDEYKGILEGILMVQKELERIFISHNIQKLESLNKIFDANFHQAMFEEPTSDATPGTVIKVIQEGYTLHERLLRPALVGVAKTE